MGEPVELQDFLKWSPPKLVPVISDGLMYAGSRVILFGRYKSLKSMIATWLGISISRGEDWLGFKTTKCRVMYLQLEVPPPQLHGRISKMMHGLNGTNNEQLWLWYEPSLKLDTDIGKLQLEAILKDIQPQVLIIDPVYKVLKDVNSATELIDNIDELKDKYNLSVLMVHHPRKKGGEQQKGEQEYGDSDDMLGSSIFLDWADSIVRVVRHTHTAVEVKFENVRHAEVELGSRHFEFDPNTMQFIKATGRKI